MADQDSVSISKFLQTNDMEVVGPGSAPGKLKVMVPTDAYLRGKQELAQNPSKDATSNAVAQDALKGLREEQELDTTKISSVMRSAYKIPEQVSIVPNKPTDAIDDSPLGFVDRFKYDFGTTTADKRDMLSEKFGKENIKFDPSSKNFLVNNKGVWQNANATGLAGVVAGSDVVAGSIIGGETGAEVGGAIGTAVIPIPVVGTAIGAGVGTIIGGGMGAVLARMATMKAAKNAGLRTEEDAAETHQELKTQFLAGMAAEAGGLVLGAGGKVLSKGVDITGDVGKTIIDSYNSISRKTVPWLREKGAMFLSRHAGGDISDNLVALNYPNEVGGHADSYYNFLKEAGKDPSLANPVEVQQAKILQTAATSLKKNMQTEWQDSWAQLSKQTDDVKVDIKPILDDARKQYQDMGLVDEDGSLLRADERQFPKTIDPKNIRVANQAYNVLVTAAEQTEGKLTFDQALTLKRNMGELLELKGSAAEITSSMQARITRIKETIDKEMWAGLSTKDPSLGKLFENMNDKYAPARKWLGQNADKFSTERVGETVQNMLSDKGLSREEAKAIFDANSVSSSDLYKELGVRKAGMGLVDAHTGANTGAVVGTYKSAVKSVSLKLAKTAQDQTPVLARGATPLSSNSLNQLQTRGMITDFVTRLPDNQRSALLRSEKGMDFLNGVLTNVPTMQRTLTDNLVRHALDQSQPTPTPLPPPKAK